MQLLRGQADLEGRRCSTAATCSRCTAMRCASARRAIQIIFQDPFASLNPRMRVFDILEEGLLALRPDIDAGAPARASRRWSTRSACAATRSSAFRTSSPAASASASPSRARWRCKPEADRLRRADLGARRVGAGADPEPAARPAARTGVSYLFITHNIGVVEYIADEVAVMQAGRIGEMRRGRSGASASALHLHHAPCWRRCRGLLGSRARVRSADAAVVEVHQ